jgi:hypothetical protein
MKEFNMSNDMTNELTRSEAAIVKALLKDKPKHKQQDIASLFAVNSRAISQIANGECYQSVVPNFDHGLSPAEITMPKINMINALRSLRNVKETGGTKPDALPRKAAFRLPPRIPPHLLN